MRKFIIATHRTLAKGLADSLDFFSNKGNEIIAINVYVDNNNFPTEKVDSLFKTFTNEDEVIIMTDILSGSVTQRMASYMNDKVFLIAGINLPLALSLILFPINEKLTSKAIEQLIEESKQQIVLVNNNQAINNSEDE